MKIVATIEDGTVGADYLSSLERAGFAREEVAVVHSGDASPLSFDGLLLCGGEDVDPELYGAVRHERLGRVNRRRDEQELALVARARRNSIPIFGICRGLQVLNVAFGGSLVQDIPSERPSRSTIPSGRRATPGPTGFEPSRERCSKSSGSFR